MRRLAAYYYSRLKQRLRRNLLLENLRLMNLVALWCFVLVCCHAQCPSYWLWQLITVNWWTMCHDWNYKGGKNTVNKQWGNFGGEKQRREFVCFMFRKIGGVYSGDTRNTIIGFPVVNPFGTSMDFRGCRHGGVEKNLASLQKSSLSLSHSIIGPSNHPRRSNHFSMIVSYCFFIFPNYWLHSVPFRWGWLKEFTTIIQKIQSVLIPLLRHKKIFIDHEPLTDMFQNSSKSILWTYDSALIRHLSYGSVSKPCTPSGHIKIAGIYGCSSH